MRRRCNICEFVGEDFDFFKIKKKVCDACLKKINDDKQFKRKEKKEERKEYLKNWNLEHKGEKKEYNKKYYQENKKNFFEYQKTYMQKLKIDEPEKYKKRRGYERVKIRREKDPLFKFKCNLRNLIKNSLTKQGYTKKSKTYDIVGVEFQDFKIYIETKFVEGMSWENYGEWHLDHIIPISSAKTEKELILLNKYTNFQPLWAIDNIRKSNFL